jgi:Fic family protein
MKAFVQREGKGRATRYRVHPALSLVFPIDEEAYLRVQLDERTGRQRYNFDLIPLLRSLDVFSPLELQALETLLHEHQKQKASLTPALLRKEYERITIELSWKSSAIEGNTYTLLETETLLKEGIQAENKSPEETQMVLNHKTALDFVRSEIQEFDSLSLPLIEHLHGLIVDKLSVSKFLRKNLVAITGTTYKPLDNSFQIREAMESMIQLVNERKDIYSKAFLALLLTSYIQPFEDGNKRTARLLANAILLHGNAFPLSFRSVSVQDYKKAILLFYELNYLPAFKRVFLEQAQFSVKNYFRGKIG